MFEIRIYSFNIKGMSEYMKMMDRRFWELRTSFSAVLGPWKTELNGLCEIIHIAQYGTRWSQLNICMRLVWEVV